MNKNNEFIYEELCYDIIGCAFEAFKTVGVGFDEIHYHKVFDNFLTQKGLRARYKVPVHLDYLGKKISEFQIDELIEDKLIIELKCIQTNFLPENFAQIITYLKLMNQRLGLLINFGLHKAFVKRVIFDAKRENDYESWDKNFFEASSMQITINNIISSVRNVNRILGPGYHSEIYKHALNIELNNNQLSCDANVRINLKIDNIKFSPIEIDYYLINAFLLLGILAGTGKPRVYDFFRMRSYLKRLNLKHGLIAFWSKTNLQLFGIYES
jgi:GxxExxY protein